MEIWPLNIWILLQITFVRRVLKEGRDVCFVCKNIHQRWQRHNGESTLKKPHSGTQYVRQNNLQSLHCDVNCDQVSDLYRHKQRHRLLVANQSKIFWELIEANSAPGPFVNFVVKQVNDMFEGLNKIACFAFTSPAPMV